MLGDFRHLFMDKPNTYATIPKGILESLAVDLPQGYSYVDIGEGFCVLKVPNGTKLKGQLYIEDATEENLKKCTSFDDLVRYSINLQKPICLLPDESGNYYLNDVAFPFSQLLQAPLRNFEMVEGSLKYMPEKLDMSFRLMLTVEEKTEYITLIRVPYNSVDYLKFVSNENNGFVISVLVKLDEPKMTINVATDFSNAGSVENVCRSIYIFNQFAAGKVKVFNEYVNIDNEAKLTPYDDEAVEYWNQLLELEKVFNVQFDVTNGVYELEVKKVRELYRSLISKTPFRTDETITNLSGSGEYSTTEEVESMEGREMYFRYLMEENFDIMGVGLSYVGIKYIFGAKIKKFDYDEATKKFEIELDKANEQQDLFTATLYFENKEKLEEFLLVEDEMKEQFFNAELISEVIAE